MNSTQEWLTRREAADLAGVHLNTIRLWERDKRVRTRKDKGVNATVYILRADVEGIVSRRQADNPLEHRLALLEHRVAMLEAAAALRSS